MNPYAPEFTSAQIAKAANMENANFRAYLRKGDWRIIGGARGGVERESNGKPHLFTIYDALGYALARELVEGGAAPAAAFNAAMQGFAHSGDADRDPGGVFDAGTHGMTLFVYWPELGTGDCMGTKGKNAIELLFPPMRNRASRATIIDLNHLRDRVFNALGLDARDYE